MGLSRTSWAVSFANACLTVLQGYDVSLMHLSFPYCDGAMNIASNAFLDSGCDEMIVIDTDIVFKPAQLAWLLEHDEPLVFGLYPKKQPGLEFPIEGLTLENPFSPNPHAPGVPPLVEIKRAAKGFMRIKREVFEELAPLVPEYFDGHLGRVAYEFWRVLPGGHSEDFAFCDKWRATGGHVLVDQRITAQHEGSAVYPIPGTF